MPGNPGVVPTCRCVDPTQRPDGTPGRSRRVDQLSRFPKPDEPTPVRIPELEAQRLQAFTDRQRRDGLEFRDGLVRSLEAVVGDPRIHMSYNFV